LDNDVERIFSMKHIFKYPLKIENIEEGEEDEDDPKGDDSPSERGA